MAMIEINLSLDLDQDACTPEARIWLDLQPQQGLSSEVEVPLWHTGSNEWRGLFSVDEKNCEEFSYRIGLCAHAEAEWSLSFRQRNLDSDLLMDRDRLTSSKCWLVGTCGVRARAKRSTPPTLEPGLNRLRRPQLVLLPGGASFSSG